MNKPAVKTFELKSADDKLFTRGDLLVFLFVLVFLYVTAQLAFHSPESAEGPTISLSPGVLPLYALYSFLRMLAAYLLSLIFALIYGYIAAQRKQAEKILIPILDILQSIPILSFLPLTILSLSAFLPQETATELASILLIFTSQAWNLVFTWYQSLTSIPEELREASQIFRLNPWLRFKSLELPFAANNLIWNSIMSWAGGWFFLMAAEIFTVGHRDFRLPGLGAYLHEAASQGNVPAVWMGLFTLIAVIVLIDQFLWRPLLAWGERFKVEMVSSEQPHSSWVYDLVHSSKIIHWVREHWIDPAVEKMDRQIAKFAKFNQPGADKNDHKNWLGTLLLVLFLIGLGYGLFQAGKLLTGVSLGAWLQIGSGLLATFLRVILALTIALMWTIPVGVAIGTNPRMAAWLQPVVQIAASIPATALFPVFLLALINLPSGIALAALLVMLMGTQWYLLFNIIAGASAIPQDMIYTTKLLHLNNFDRWTKVYLPAIFPYLVTGAITASGGAWNASVVAEFFAFEGKTVSTTGIGAMIANATASGDYALLLASTMSLVIVVVIINRFFWHRLYNLSQERFRME